MKKGMCLNSELSYVISKMGHFDCMAIGDAGLPIPDGVKRIDLAVSPGVPAFLQVFEAAVSELQVQKMTVASEMKEKNGGLYTYLTEFAQKNGIAVEEVLHEEFKRRTAACKAVVRTGECSPFANVILESGVVF